MYNSLFTGASLIASNDLLHFDQLIKRLLSHKNMRWRGTLPPTLDLQQVSDIFVMLALPHDLITCQLLVICEYYPYSVQGKEKTLTMSALLDTVPLLQKNLEIFQRPSFLKAVHGVRAIEGYLHLYLAHLCKSRESALASVRSFLSICNLEFTDLEVQFLEKIDWGKSPFYPEDVCPTLAMAEQLDQRHVVTHFLVVSQSYPSALEKLRWKSYLQEWKWCLTFVTSEKVRPREIFRFRDQGLAFTLKDHFDDVLSLFSDFKGEICHPWVGSLVRESCAFCRKLIGDKPESERKAYRVFLEFFQKLTPKSLGVSGEFCKSLLEGFHVLLVGISKPFFSSRIIDSCKLDQSTFFFQVERSSLLEEILQLDIGDVRYKYNDSSLHSLVKKKNPFAIEIYRLLWKLLFVSIRDSFDKKEHSFANWGWVSNNTYLALVSTGILNLFDESKNFGIAPKETHEVKSDTQKMAQRLSVGEVYVDFVKFLSPLEFRGRLKTLSNVPEIDSMYSKVVEMMNQYLQQWKDLLASIQVMFQCPKFEKLARKLFERYSEECSQLQKREICDWKPPSCPENFQKVSDMLSKLRDSIFFQYVWKNPLIGADLSPSAGDSDSQLFQKWEEYLRRYIQEWQNLVANIRKGVLSVELFHDFFEKELGGIVKEQNQVRAASQEEIKVRYLVEKRIQDGKMEIGVQVEKELKLASSLLNELFDISLIQERVDVCISALCSCNNFLAFQKILISFDLPSITPLDTFCGLFEKADRKEITMSQVIDLYREIVTAIPQFGTIIQGYPALFYHVMLKNDLLSILKTFRDVLHLNQTIDNRQSEDIQEGAYDLLSALRIVGATFMAHPLYQKMIGNEKISLPSLIDFLINCSAMVGLSILKDKVKLESGTSLEEALRSVSEEKQTIAIVKSLLKNGGAFVLDIANGEVTVSALQNYADSKLKSKITAEELEALPSQLLLTSGVISEDEEYDYDAPLPENIARWEDRKPYVQRFNWLFDRTFALSKIIRDLCLSGHPHFQSNQMIINCAVRVKKLEGWISTHQEQLEKWRNVFGCYRADHPILSFLSRSQLVSCLSALTTKNVNLLFSIFQSIGCDPSLMHSRLSEKVQILEKTENASSLFTFLANCFGEFLNVQTLEMGQVQPQDRILHPLENVDSTFKLIRVSMTPIEEVVCGIHIALHNRLPSSVELLFCTPRTSEVDIADFIDRWKLYSQVRGPGTPNVSFWLISVENLNYRIQTQCLQMLQHAPKTPDQAHLFLVSGSEDTHISSVLLRNQVSLSLEMCEKYCKLIYPFASSFDNIFIVHSSHCGEGKTEGILKQFVCNAKNEEGGRVLHCQISVDTTPMEVHLKKLAEDCPPSLKQPIVLHFNVGHMVQQQQLNLFLFQYLLVGSWRDALGFTHPRRQQDTIVIELTNTGEKDERNRVSICRYFQEFPLLHGISYSRVIPHLYEASRTGMLYWFTLEPVHETGAKILKALFQTLTTDGLDMGTTSDVFDIQSPNDEELFHICDSLANDCFCPNGHFCVSLPMEIECCQCAQVALNCLGCVDCGYFKCHSCIDNTMTSSSRLLFLRRFFLISAVQLQMLTTACGFWDTGGDNQTLAYHYARLILRSAKELAKPALIHFDKTTNLDDADRCAGMQKFEDWRGTPFYISTEKNFHVISTSGETPMNYIVRTLGQHPQNAEFAQNITDYERYIPSVSRGQLQDYCAHLAEDVYSYDHPNPSLEELLPIVGCFSGPLVLFSALNASRKYPGTALLEVVVSEEISFRRAIDFLSAFGVEVDRIVDCTDFVGECVQFLRNLFGNKKEKPPYCLTADNILRLISVQIRLSARIPVCIMGETGCGKSLSSFFLPFFFPLKSFPFLTGFVIKRQN